MKGKTPVLKPVSRVIIPAIILGLTPFLRSCGDVSYGFPFVAIEATSSYSPTGFRPVALLFNVFAMAVLIFIVLPTIKLRRTAARDGIRAVVIYNVIIWLGFLAVYPLMSTGEVMGYAAGIFLYLIYPFYAFADSLGHIIPSSWATSSLFGDRDDIPLRIIYTFTMLLWFLAGCFISRYRSKTSSDPE